MVASAGPRKKTCSRILKRLQSPKQVVIDAVEQHVTVVQAAGYESLDYNAFRSPNIQFHEYASKLFCMRTEDFLDSGVSEAMP